MNDIHKRYNLQFVKQSLNGLPEKRVFQQNKTDQSFVPLYFYIIQIRFVDNIDLILEEVNNALNWQPFNDGIEVGSETVNLTQRYVEIIDQGITLNIPTIDFKSILEEYKIFLETWF